MSRTRTIMVMVGIMVGMLLAAIDQTVVGTAMPRIIADLNGLQHYAWVFTAYMLTSTVMVPIYGKLSDIYGRRPFFLAGIVIFLIGSALSGLSQDMTQLIIFRGIQGLGAGAMMPISQAIIGDLFTPAERGKWQGIMMAVFGLATITGPTIGGLITDNWGWHWVFYVNMPIGILALLTAGLAMPALSSHREHTIDYFGAATLVAGTTPLLLAFSWAGGQYEWLSVQIIGLLAVSLVMFVAFYLIVMRSPEPIISPRLFNNSIFSVSIITTFLVSVGMFGAIMYLPLFVQGALGISATNSGAILTPMMLGVMASSIMGGQLLARTGRYKVLALGSFVVAGVGMFLLSTMTIATSQNEIIRNMVIVGLGMGVTMSLFTVVVQNAFPPRQLGEVTASLAFFRSIGGTIGVAILGSVMANRFSSALQGNIPDQLKAIIPPSQLAALENPEVLLSPETTVRIQQGFAAMGPQGQAIFQQLMTAIQSSLASAISGLFMVSVSAMALAFVATLFLREIPLRKTHHDVPLAVESLEALSTESVDTEAEE
ncbi:MAG: MDR family MFS transporter [Dehalococcoidia bacterium]|nr:MDR family MFS transporter [Dehalococcoidia bacterium]